MQNLARKYLNENGKTEKDYYMWCASLCDEITQTGDHVVYVDGDVDRDYPWAYHQVMMRNGFVHDAWHPNQIEATPINKWLIDMFGPEAWVEVCIDGYDIFAGYCKNFQFGALAKAA